MRSPPALEALFRILAAERVPAGPRERLLIAAVFEQAPEVTCLEDLLNLVRPVLRPNRGDGESVERALALWGESLNRWFETESVTQERPALDAGTAPALQGAATLATERPRTWLSPRGWLLLGFLLMVLAGAAQRWWSERSDPPIVEPSTPATPPARAEAATTTSTLDLPTLTLEFTAGTQVWSGWGALGIALAGGVCVWLIWRRRERFTLAALLQPVEDSPSAKGPTRLALPSSAPVAPLFARQERARMVWGVDQYRSEDASRSLDVDATIDATIRDGGAPHVLFENDLRHRTLWLLVDAAAGAAAESLAQELAEALQRAKLDCEIAYFAGLPLEVHRPTHRSSESVLGLSKLLSLGRVAVITDGAGILRAERSRLQSLDFAPVRRLFAHAAWLALVNLRPDDPALPQWAAAHGIRCLRPEQLPAFLGGEAIDRRPASTDRFAFGTSRTWMTYALLAPDGILDERLRSLPAAVPFVASADTYLYLREVAQVEGQRLRWPTALRSERLGVALAAALVPPLDEAAPVNADDFSARLRPGSELSAALAYWCREYEILLDPQQVPLPPWWETRARLEFELEAAILRLWLHPSSAALALAGLPESLRPRVKRLLGELQAYDAPVSAAEARVRLPWSWQELGAETQLRLAALGLGGTAALEAAAPGRWYAGITLSVCIALAALAALPFAPKEAPRQPHLPPPAAADELSREYSSPIPHLLALREMSGEWQALLVAGREVRQMRVPAGAILSIRADFAPTLCDFQPVSATETRYGAWPVSHRAVCVLPLATANPKRRPWPRTLAVLEGGVNDAGIRDFARALLRSGSVDEVALVPRGTKWTSPVGDQLFAPGTALYFFSRSLADTEQRSLASIGKRGDWPAQPDRPIMLVDFIDWPAAERAMLASKERPADEVWPGVTMLAGELPLIAGVSLSLPVPTLVTIPAGSVAVGDASEAQPVAVFSKPFLMGAHEVTFEQFDAFALATRREKPDDSGWGRGARPVINIDWTEASAYAAWLGGQLGTQCRLPTLAEWEYAARAGTKTNYGIPAPGGSNDIAGKNLANCDGCGSRWDNQKTAPVGSFPSNDWGLHDMHGNVWEWLTDCFADESNPLAQDRRGSGDGKTCDARILLGGSWLNIPALAGVASRNWNSPSYGNYHVGFRVVCSAPFLATGP